MPPEAPGASPGAESANPGAPGVRSDRTAALGAAVTVVTVAYRSGAVLPGMIASVPGGVPIVVVDNDGRDAPTPLPERAGLRLVREAANLGFGVACNHGAALAETPLLLFLNPDARLRPGALEAMVAAAGRHPEAVAFNPTLLDGSGRPHPKRRSVLLPRREWLSRDGALEDGKAPVLSGAALMVRREAFRRVEGFDPAIFLYHEDDDLSLRLRALGPLRLATDAVVEHAEGRSSARDPATAAWKGRHQGRSRVYAARKHGVRLGAARALGGALLAVLNPGIVTARKRAKILAYLRGVLEELRAPSGR